MFSLMCSHERAWLHDKVGVGVAVVGQTAHTPCSVQGGNHAVPFMGQMQHGRRCVECDRVMLVSCFMAATSSVPACTPWPLGDSHAVVLQSRGV